MCSGLVALLVVVLAGCGASNAARVGRGATIDVTERDFGIVAPKIVQSGNVVFRVENQGPDAHEFLVVRAGAVALPLRSDGLTVNEEGLQRRIVGNLETGPPGAVRDLQLRLQPGRYVLFCNMSGHFMGGMHAMLVVR